MAHLYAHGKNFIHRLYWLSPLMGGILPTAKYLIKARAKPLKVGTANYNNKKFEFRNCDTTALKEVLVDTEYQFLEKIIKSQPEPLIIDIGAHIGTFSLWCYNQNPNSKIIMVEANPASYEILKRNIKECSPQNTYKILNNAAWKNNKTINFSTTGDSMGNKVSEFGDTQIKGLTFKQVYDIASEYNTTIDIMKIDIEGAEEAFFETADLCLGKIKHLVIELHPKSCNTNIVREKLQQNFQYIYEVPNRIDTKPVLYCSNKNNL